MIDVESTWANSDGNIKHDTCWFFPWERDNKFEKVKVLLFFLQTLKVCDFSFGGQRQMYPDNDVDCFVLFLNLTLISNGFWLLVLHDFQESVGSKIFTINKKLYKIPQFQIKDQNLGHAGNTQQIQDKGRLRIWDMLAMYIKHIQAFVLLKFIFGSSTTLGLNV